MSTSATTTPKPGESTFTHLLNWSSNIISSVCFLIWTVQLFRCGYYYTLLYTKGGSRTSRLKGAMIFLVHLLLMIANVLYLVYETDITDTNPIPMMFNMYFILNFSSVISFRMMTMSFEEDKC